MTHDLQISIVQITSWASVSKVRLLTPVWLIAVIFGIDGFGIGAAFGATPAKSNPNTVILDHFDGTTQGTAFGNPAYVSSLPGLTKAVNLTAGTFVQYQIPASFSGYQSEGYFTGADDDGRPSRYTCKHAESDKGR